MSGIDSSAPADGALVNLSVHSLPSPREAMAARRTARGRLVMLVVLLVCAAPVIASYLAYFVVRPQTRSNYSDLVVPPRPLPGALALADLDGRAVAPRSLLGQWLLIVVAGGACDARCERNLWLQRQLHEALGAEKDRVDKVWLVDDGHAPRPQTLAAMAAATGAAASSLRTPAVGRRASGQSAGPGAPAQPSGREERAPSTDPSALAQVDSSRAFSPALVMQASRAELASWLAPASGAALEDHLYLVDPRGDWMLRAPADADPTRLKRDLDRLLRASAAWDRAGR